MNFPLATLSLSWAYEGVRLSVEAFSDITDFDKHNVNFFYRFIFIFIFSV